MLPPHLPQTMKPKPIATAVKKPTRAVMGAMMPLDRLAVKNVRLKIRKPGPSLKPELKIIGE